MLKVSQETITNNNKLLSEVIVVLQVNKGKNTKYG